MRQQDGDGTFNPKDFQTETIETLHHFREPGMARYLHQSNMDMALLDTMSYKKLQKFQACLDSRSKVTWVKCPKCDGMRCS